MSTQVGRAEYLLDADTRRANKTLQRFNRDAERHGVTAGENWSEGMSDGIDDGSRNIASSIDDVGDDSSRRMGRHGRDSGDRFGKGFWRSARESFVKPFSLLDGEVKLVLGVIAATFSEAAALGSGLAGAFTAIASTIGPALGALGSFSALLPGLAYGLGLATNGLSNIEELAPKASASLDNLKRVFEEVDVPRFMAQWEDSLSKFLDTLANSLEFDQIAEALGQSFAIITEAFTGVVQSPSFKAFTEAMETTLPAALAFIGDGVASLVEAFLGFSAAAAPVVAQMSAAFGDAAAELAAWVEEGLRTGEITAMVEAWAESLEVVFDLMGNVTKALSTLFMTGQETGNSILTTISDLFYVWNEWMQSVEGQTALQDWFAQGEEIFNALLPLVAAVGTAISDLVTPEAVAQLLTFIESLTAFMPILSDVLGLFSDLNVVGIFAALLDAVREALEPVMPQLSALATEIGEALVAAIVALTPLLVILIENIVDMLPVIEPLIPAFVELIETLVEGLAPILEELSPIIQDLAAIIADDLETKLDALMPVLEILVDLFVIIAQYVLAILGPAVEGLAAIFRNVGRRIDSFRTGVLEPLRNFIGRLADRISTWRQGLSRAGDAARNLGQRIQQWLINKFRRGVEIVNQIKDAFSTFRSTVSSAVNSIVGALGRISWPTPPSWLTNGINGVMPRFFARGGVVAGPTRAVIGEAGPEMVVPLARPLSQVDPAVRDVAAYAQGKTPAFASGGMAGGGVNIAPGAIQVVSPYANPALVAEEVLDDLVLAGR